MADRPQDRIVGRLDENLIWRDAYRAEEFYYRNHVVRDPSTGLIWRARVKTTNTAPPLAATLTDPIWDPVGMSLTAAQIVELINTELGSDDWQGGGGAGGVVDLSVANRDADSLEIASDTGGTPAVVPSASITEAGLQSAADKAKLDGIEAGAEANVDTDLAIGTHNGTDLQVTSSTGADVTLPSATPVAGTNKAGLMSAADKTKLDGIEAGAQANVATDLAVANRDNDSLDLTSSTGADATIPAASDTEAGLLTGTNKVKLDGIEAGAEVNLDTDLAIGTHDATQLQVTSSTGTDVTLPLATLPGGTNLAGLLSPAEKEKLDAIVLGATGHLFNYMNLH